MPLRLPSVLVIAAALTAGSSAWAQQGPGQPGAEAAAARRAATDQRRAAAGNLVGHGGPVKSIRVEAATGRVLTGSFDYAMTDWWIERSGQPALRPRRFEDHGGAVNAVAFAAPGTIHVRLVEGKTGGHTSLTGAHYAVAAADDGTVTVWGLGDGRRLHRFAGHGEKAVALAVSPDGWFAASAGWDRTARLWDLGKLLPGPVLGGHAGPVTAVAFAGDGRRVYTASADGNLRAFEAATGNLERVFHRHGWGINVLERIPGTDHLLFGAVNGSAAIIDPSSGDLVRELPAHGRPVLALAVNEQSGLIATGGGDGIINVLRAADGLALETHKHPAGPVWALAFLPDGSGLYYGGLDDFATLWRIRPRQSFEPVESPFPRRFQVARQPGTATTPADPRATLLAEGELQFARKCSVCHTLDPDGANRAGPTLHKVFGRRAGTLAGYTYSDALRGLPIVWDADTIGKLFELGPDVLTPGSKMPLQRMTDAGQRHALVEYLKVATSDAPADGPTTAASGGSDASKEKKP